MLHPKRFQAVFFRSIRFAILRAWLLFVPLIFSGCKYYKYITIDTNQSSIVSKANTILTLEKNNKFFIVHHKDHYFHLTNVLVDTALKSVIGIPENLSYRHLNRIKDKELYQKSPIVEKEDRNEVFSVAHIKTDKVDKLDSSSFVSIPLNSIELIYVNAHDNKKQKIRGCTAMAGGCLVAVPLFFLIGVTFFWQN